MNIVSSNAKYSVSLGGSDTWIVLCSTIRYHLSKEKYRLKHVFAFIESGVCENANCLETAKEFNLVRDALSDFGPDQIVFDEKNPKALPPWGKNISPIITSCSNYLTTGDGNDLLAEIVKIFTQAYYTKANVKVV